MVKCPHCGFESIENNFKLLRNPWRFRFYTVKKYECPRCLGVFQYYSGVSPSGREVEFTIRIKPGLLYEKK